MKTTFTIFLAGLMTVSVAKAGENSMEERIQALKSELKVSSVESVSHVKIEQSVCGRGPLSPQKFKTIGSLTVRHRSMDEEDGHIISEKLQFVDQKDERQAFAEVKRANSPRAAKENLLRELATNSLPLEVLLKIYKVKQEGPGDFCVTRMTFDKTTQQWVPDESEVYFVRGNIAVSVRATDANVKAIKLASKMDRKLVGGEEKSIRK